MASTASGGVGLLAIAWLATRRLSGAELGFFFSFLSFGALVQLADFGLSYAALQTAGQLAGTGRLHELPGLSARVWRWNVVAGSLACLAVAGIGWMTFSSHGSVPTSSAVAWARPWVAFVASVFLNQLTTPGISLREGGGKVTQMWRLRLVQEWVAGLACLLVLHLDGGLWSLSAFASARAIVAGTWLTLGDPIATKPGGEAYSSKRWMAEVWPFQWKVGLSGLSGFLIFRAFAPLILLERGPVMAGRFGLTISLMNLLISVSTAWPLSQAARFASLIAARRLAELRREFPVLLSASTALAAAAAAVSAFSLWQLYEKGYGFALRLTDPVTTAVFLGTAVVHHVVGCFAVLLRAEGREPMLGISVVGAVANAVAILLAARFGSPFAIALANLACAASGLLVTLHIVWRRWGGFRP
jgi:hypothetical protein